MHLFIDGIMPIISEENTHAPAVGNQTKFALRFADDLEIGSFTINGLQRGINQTVKYCYKYNLKLNVNTTKVMVLKKGVKQKRIENIGLRIVKHWSQ
jgi:hypothetical protein